MDGTACAQPLDWLILVALRSVLTHWLGHVPRRAVPAVLRGLFLYGGLLEIERALGEPARFIGFGMFSQQAVRGRMFSAFRDDLMTILVRIKSIARRMGAWT